MRGGAGADRRVPSVCVPLRRVVLTRPACHAPRSRADPEDEFGDSLKGALYKRKDFLETDEEGGLNCSPSVAATPPVARRRRRLRAWCRAHASLLPGPHAAAKLHPKRTYYYRQAVDLDKLIEQCSGKVRRWRPAARCPPPGPVHDAAGALGRASRRPAGAQPRQPQGTNELCAPRAPPRRRPRPHGASPRCASPGCIYSCVLFHEEEAVRAGPARLRPGRRPPARCACPPCPARAVARPRGSTGSPRAHWRRCRPRGRTW